VHDQPPETTLAETEQRMVEDDLPFDTGWEDAYDGGSGSEGIGSEEDYSFENRSTAPETLREHLTEQMRLMALSPQDQVIALALIDAIDEWGYLTASIEDIQQSLGEGTEREEIEAVLHSIQSCHPPGVAARGLRECLLIQLRQQHPTTPWREQAMELVGKHLEVLAKHDYTQLTRQLGVSEQDLQSILTLIRSLNPRPGNLVEGTPTPYVTPDLIVKKYEGQWLVELNPEAIPRIRINSHYLKLMRQTRGDEDHRYLKNQLQEARWFLKSLYSRNQTLLRVARCIVERQTAFLEHGDEAMQPMVLHDIAEELGMHESTISRVTTQKYMHTPRGIFELKYFFSSHVSTITGGACSATALRALIKRMIGAEDPTKPLSDSQIADLLADQGIQVARRTVAKYREIMLIPSARERRHLT
jgi:RNA polymerase sigma-54 factor